MKYFFLVPRADPYPHSAITRGLEALGWEAADHQQADVLLTWSTWKGTTREAMADQFRARGAKVVVFENGWLSPIRDQRYFQIALDGWNGTGTFPPGDL